MALSKEKCTMRKLSKHVALLLAALAIALGGLTFLAPQHAHAGSTSDPVLLVHGFSLSSAQNCNTSSMFGDIESFFNGQGITSTRSLGYYNGDSSCNAYLKQEKSHCTGWYDSGSNDGTVNEDIRHTSCLLAWYIWDTYTSHGVTVAVVAHSMGGILIRQAMNDTPYVGAFPPYLMVSDVVTAGTPHQGLPPGAAWTWETFQGCPGNCVEVAQMERTNGLMSNMNSTSFRGGFARNPQGYGGTDWTSMASNNDELLSTCPSIGQESLGASGGVSAGSECGLMPGGTHFVVYTGPTPSYCHGCYLTDADTSWSADVSYSDTNGGTWYTTTSFTHAIQTMYYAVLYSSW
jgi:hypothetical protein